MPVCENVEIFKLRHTATNISLRWSYAYLFFVLNDMALGKRKRNISTAEAFEKGKRPPGAPSVEKY